MVSLLGNDHVKFGCGAAARCARTLGGVEHVCTVLINPRSGDTTRSTDLRRPALPLTALQLPFAASREAAGSAAWLKRPYHAGSQQPVRSPARLLAQGEPTGPR